MASSSIFSSFNIIDEIKNLVMDIPFCDGEEDGVDYKVTNLLKDNNESYVFIVYIFF